MKSFANVGVMLLWVVCWAGACSTAPKTMQERRDLQNQATTALNTAKSRDASLASLLRRSAGYAVFPEVGKGAFVVGGAYGRGVLFESGRIVGYCDITQASVGFQVGGQAYTEIIVFETEDAVDRFKAGRLEFDAQATAVAITAGAGANASYRDGVTIFTMSEAGLMYEASIGGQKFSYHDK